MFAQINTKTVYTFMDSLITIPKYIQEAKRMGYSHLGVMDINTMYAAYDFMEKCHKEGLKPILGLELDCLLDDREVTMQFVALNTDGYRNLMTLSTLKMTSENRWDNFRKYRKDIAVIIPYFEGIRELKLNDDYYIGVDFDTPKESFDHPILPMPTVRYFAEEDREVLQMLQAIKENERHLSDVNLSQKKQSFLEPKVMTDFFESHFPGSVQRLENLIMPISYQIDKRMKLPRFNPNRPAESELKEKVYQGLKEKKLTRSDYYDRAEEELSVIHRMGFDDYFLIVWDILRFAKSRQYYMGMGRGSAVGSLVAYALDITGIDPIKNHLLFERFLNSERSSMPDIDIDMPDLYRSEFLKYVAERYGSRHVAQIVTFSTFGAKQVIRDVFKRYGASEYELTQLTKQIRFGESLQDTFQKSMIFRQAINSKLEFKNAFRIAQKIEGFPRQTSIHAAGIVMSDDDLLHHIPLKKGEDLYITQYDAHGVEDNGLLKMDFLGLRNLTFIQKMRDEVAKRYHLQIEIKSIDLEDPDTIALFAKGKTKGIFQFEAAGAISLLRRVQPDCFEDIVATTSLNRPGASDYINDFIKGRQGKTKMMSALDASIRPIVENTYGIMLYQEQVMQIAQVYAGFSLGRADILRRAMSKKKKEVMQSMASEFINGAIQKGHSREQAKHLFAMIEKFAGYGFNRSHAFAYSALAFQMAYFKVHYPDVFYTILVNQSKTSYLQDALQSGFKLSKVDINSVPYYDKFEKETISLGLKNIKSLPKDFAYWIIENRPFTSVIQFITQLPEQYQKESFLTLLIKVGLFDQFEPNRRKIIANLNHLFEFTRQLGTLFAEDAYQWIEADDFSNLEKFDFEKTIIGAGISEHPIFEIEKKNTTPIHHISELTENETARLLIQLQTIKVIKTKKTGESMAFLEVTDARNQLDVTVFPDLYRSYRNDLIEGIICYIKGKVQIRNGKKQLILDKMTPSEKLWIKLETHQNDEQIAAILKQFPGIYEVALYFEEENKTYISKKYKVSRSQDLLDRLQEYSQNTIFK